MFPTKVYLLRDLHKESPPASCSGLPGHHRTPHQRRQKLMLPLQSLVHIEAIWIWSNPLPGNYLRKVAIISWHGSGWDNLLGIVLICQVEQSQVRVSKKDRSSIVSQCSCICFEIKLWDLWFDQGAENVLVGFCGCLWIWCNTHYVSQTTRSFTQRSSYRVSPSELLLNWRLPTGPTQKTFFTEFLLKLDSSQSWRRPWHEHCRRSASIGAEPTVF